MPISMKIVIALLGICSLAFAFLGIEDILVYNEKDDLEFWKYRVPPTANSHVIENVCKWPVINEVRNEMASGRRRIISDICGYTWLMRAELDEKSTLTLDVVEGYSNLFNSTNCYYEKIALSGEHQQPSQFDWKQTISVSDPVFHVRCESGNKTVFEQTFHNWERLVPTAPNSAEQIEEEPVSISLIALPGIGSLQFGTLFPKTSDFMKTENFISMNMFNQISDTSIGNLLHIMNGPNGESLIKIAEEQGCTTITNEDSHIFNQSSAFEDKAQINFKKFFNWNGTENIFCSKNGLTVYEEFLENFRSSAYLPNSRCVASFNYFSQFSSLTDMEISHFDSVLRLTLERLKLSPDYERMVFVIVAVNSVTGMDETMSDAMLKRNPFLTIRIPHSYRIRHVMPSYFVEQNAMRLTANYDVYETVKAFLNSVKLSKEPSRGVSLLSEEISDRSTCSSKSIPRHLCLCMVEKTEQSDMLQEQSEQYKHIFDIVERHLTQLSCVRNISIETEEFGQNAKVYSLSDDILSHISHTDDLYEYVEIGYKTKTIDQKSPFYRSMRISGFARLRRRLATNEFEVLTPVPMLIKPRFCWARDMMRVCEMCASEIVLSN